MTPIKFPHQQFLEDNQAIINTHPLPEMLQKRILGFEELRDDLAHTTDEDRDQLLGKLEKLSYELDEDLEEYFESYLENNDEEKEEPLAQFSEIHPPRHEPDVKLPDIAPEPPKDPEKGNEQKKTGSHEKVMNRNPLSVKASGLSDEEIIGQAVKDRMSFIHPSELFKRGYKGVLEDRTIFVGRFCLQRARYETCYRITLRGE